MRTTRVEGDRPASAAVFAALAAGGGGGASEVLRTSGAFDEEDDDEGKLTELETGGADLPASASGKNRPQYSNSS